MVTGRLQRRPSQASSDTPIPSSTVSIWEARLLFKMRSRKLSTNCTAVLFSTHSARPVPARPTSWPPGLWLLVPVTLRPPVQVRVKFPPPPHLLQVEMPLFPSGPLTQLAPHTINSFYDWTARIRVKKYALAGSFSVLIFLGEVPENPRSWRSSPSFVGAHHAFVNSAADQCENCRNQADLVIEGFVHLNTAIAQRSGLGSFEPAVVEPYLKRELSWRVQKVSLLPSHLSQMLMFMVSPG